MWKRDLQQDATGWRRTNAGRSGRNQAKVMTA